MKIEHFKKHPWHGIQAHSHSPNIVWGFIEITPLDDIKYEIHKDSGYLMVDRPQKYSNQTPSLYGFIPQTYCGERIAEYCMLKSNLTNIVGDGDPLDICVLTEKAVYHGDILVKAVPIGGFRFIDNNEADDKIIAVLESDEIYGKYKNLSDLPIGIINRLKHYFLTYKQIPGESSKTVISDVYEAEEARKVIELSIEDYVLFISK